MLQHCPSAAFPLQWPSVGTSQFPPNSWRPVCCSHHFLNVLPHQPCHCSAPPSPGRSLPPPAHPLPFPGLAVTPLLSARCQESSEHGGSAQPGAGEQAQSWLPAWLSLSLPALGPCSFPWLRWCLWPPCASAPGGCWGAGSCSPSALSPRLGGGVSRGRGSQGCPAEKGCCTCCCHPASASVGPMGLSCTHRDALG